MTLKKQLRTQGRKVHEEKQTVKRNVTIHLPTQGSSSPRGSGVMTLSKSPSCGIFAAASRSHKKNTLNRLQRINQKNCGVNVRIPLLLRFFVFFRAFCDSKKPFSG